MPTVTELLWLGTVTGNDTLDAPAGRNTVAGTEASLLSLLDTGMVTPPAGAAVVAVIVAVAVPAPAITAGDRVTVDTSNAGGGVGTTVRVALLLTPAEVAVMVTSVEALTAVVEIGND